MHHTTRALRAVRGALLTLVVFGLGTGLARAQDEAPAVVVPVNGTYKLSIEKNITKVFNPKEDVIRVAPVEGDPKSILITGLAPGVATITITDVDNKDRKYQVVVQYDVEYLKTVIKRAVPTASVEPEPGANQSVILRGTVAKATDVDIILRIASNLVGAERVINALVVGGVMQVQLCCTVAEVSRSDLREMSFTFLETGQRHFFSSTLGISPSFTGVNGPLSVNSAAASLAGAPGDTNLFLGIINNKQGFSGFLQALKSENVTKILSEPKLVTLSGRSASLLSGGQQAVPVPAGLGQVGVQFYDFGTTLNVLPIVMGNGKIYMEVNPQISTLDNASGTTIQGTTVPGRLTQSVSSKVELEPGQTLAIGGLIQQQVTGDIVKVPVLGDIPFLNVFFSSKSYKHVETELVVLVTPYLVDGMSINQVPKILPGQETRSPDDYELFLEGILEAPRGPRTPCPDGKYVPAYKNGPSAGAIPCAGGNGGCGTGGCGNGNGNGYGDPLGGVAPVNGHPAAAPVNGQPIAAPVNGQPAATPAVTPPPAGQPSGDNGSTAGPTGQSLPGTFPAGAAPGGDSAVPSTMPARLVPPGTR
jgi:pilus assembly protein CpaC